MYIHCVTHAHRIYMFLALQPVWSIESSHEQVQLQLEKVLVLLPTVGMLVQV